MKDRCEDGSEAAPLVAALTLLSLACLPWVSSITVRTLRSLDSDFLDGGCEFLLEEETVGGDMDLAGGGEIERGGEGETGEGISAHAEFDSEKYPPVLGIHDAFGGLVAASDGARSGVEELCGLGEDEGALAITDSGGRIENIWSSVVGGP